MATKPFTGLPTEQLKGRSGLKKAKSPKKDNENYVVEQTKMEMHTKGR